MTGLIVLIVWILFWILWGIFATLTSQRNERYKHLISYPIIVLFLIFVAFFFSYPPPELGFLKYRFVSWGFGACLMGFILMVAGLGFAVWARIYLGRSWRGDIKLTPQHQLIQSGPYKYVRHPIYSGMILAIIGTVLVLGELWVLVMFFVTTFAFVTKSRKEEKLLLQQFPGYSQYKAKVKAFLPYLF